MIYKKLTLELIKEFKRYIESNDFTGFYRSLYNLRHGTIDKSELTLHSKNGWEKLGLSGRNIGAVTDVFYEAGILPDVLNSLNDIPDLMFMGSKQTYELKIPSNIKTVGREAFEGTEFQKITFEEGCTKLQEQAFFGCHAKEIILPDSLKYIGREAFRFCSFSEITIPPNISRIDDHLFGNPSLIVNLPKKIEENYTPDEIKKMMGSFGKINFY